MHDLRRINGNNCNGLIQDLVRIRKEKSLWSALHEKCLQEDIEIGFTGILFSEERYYSYVNGGLELICEDDDDRYYDQVIREDREKLSQLVYETLNA